MFIGLCSPPFKEKYVLSKKIHVIDATTCDSSCVPLFILVWLRAQQLLFLPQLYFLP